MTTATPPDLTFDAWIKQKAEAIAEARGVSVEDVATEPGEVSRQIARARQHFVAMGELKADASSWVNKTRALAVVRVRKENGDYGADERKIMIDADPEYVRAVHVRSELTVTVTALRGMIFEIMNGRRSNVPSGVDNDD